MKDKKDIKSLVKKLTEKAKIILKKIVSFLLNPHLLICFGIAWMITNGWSYLFLFFGSIFKIRWMFVVATAYLGFLWIPFTPEKIVTVIISIFLLKIIFPNDTRTLAILEKDFKKLKDSLKLKKNKRKKHNADEGSGDGSTDDRTASDRSDGEDESSDDGLDSSKGSKIVGIKTSGEDGENGEEDEEKGINDVSRGAHLSGSEGGEAAH